MICHSCRRSLALAVRRTQFRTVASTPASSTTTASIEPSPASPGTPQQEKKVPLQSSIAGGVELKGLGYLKAQPHITAKEDSEYPEWLWTLLDTDKQTDGKSLVDLAAMTKKQRIKYDRKQAKLMKDVPKPIPIHEQSNDLTKPGDSADTSLQKRQELTKSSREARRKSIRESNFLRGM